MASIVTSDDDGRTPVLLRIDIGADLDDTPILLTMGWMVEAAEIRRRRHLGRRRRSRAAASCAAGCAGSATPTARCPCWRSVDAATAGVVAPPARPTPADEGLGIADTPRASSRSRARTARGSRSSASPRLTPIAAALREPGGRDALRGIGRLYLQASGAARPRR